MSSLLHCPAVGWTPVRLHTDVKMRFVLGVQYNVKRVFQQHAAGAGRSR